MKLLVSGLDIIYLLMGKLMGVPNIISFANGGAEYHGFGKGGAEYHQFGFWGCLI